MNYQAFTNASLTMMHHGFRGALAADDAFSDLGADCKFRVRETQEWKVHAAALEAEMVRRGMLFDVIDWSEPKGELKDLGGSRSDEWNMRLLTLVGGSLPIIILTSKPASDHWSL